MIYVSQDAAAHTSVTPAIGQQSQKQTSTLTVDGRRRCLVANATLLMLHMCSSVSKPGDKQYSDSRSESPACETFS